MRAAGQTGGRRLGAAARVAVACAFLSLAACKTTPDLLLDEAAFTSTTTRRFPGETRERIVRAAEAVLRQSDPSRQITTRTEGFASFKQFESYGFVVAEGGGDLWTVTSRDLADGAEAVVRLAPRNGAGPSGPAMSITEGRNPAPLYDLFWSRVEYVLGRRPDWTTCQGATARLQGSGQGPSAIGALCASPGEGRAAPPPPVMEASAGRSKATRG
jgi:hypothetical protein